MSRVAPAGPKLHPEGSGPHCATSACCLSPVAHSDLNGLRLQQHISCDWVCPVCSASTLRAIHSFNHSPPEETIVTHSSLKPSAVLDSQLAWRPLKAGGGVVRAGGSWLHQHLTTHSPDLSFSAFPSKTRKFHIKSLGAGSVLSRSSSIFLPSLTLLGPHEPLHFHPISALVSFTAASGTSAATTRANPATCLGADQPDWPVRYPLLSVLKESMLILFQGQRRRAGYC